MLSVLRDRESFLCAPDGTAHLSVVLRASTTLTSRGTSYHYKGKFCCRDMFKAIYLIGNDRLKKITRLNQTNSTAFQRRKSITNSESIDARVKLDRTIVFWRGYFDDHCQKPNDETWLWPSHQTFDDIYSRFFSAWYGLKYPGDDVPGMSTFKRARHDPQFSNIKKRVSHYHLKCTTCKYYGDLLNNGFLCAEQKDKMIEEREAHEHLHRTWRQKEEKLMQQASHSPESLCLIRCDDTSPVSLPHTGQREVKGLSQATGYEVIPWCVQDVSRGLCEYVYTPKRLVPHGSNRFCTLLHTVLQANRTCGTDAAKSRRLVIIVDNYSENRCYNNFSFLTEVVMSGWFDTVELLYGPVGHTHNGIDAMHHIHNTQVGKYFAGTLADWINNFRHAFKSDRTRPSASICLIQYDWDGHYKNNKVKLEGIDTRDEAGALLAVGFKIGREGNDPLVRVWFTQDTGMTPQWVGADGKVNSEGVVALTRRPFAPPKQIPPFRTARLNKVLKLLKNKVFVQHMQANNAEDCIEWVREAATTGMVPVIEYLEDEYCVPGGRFGTPARIGTARLSVVVDVVVGHKPDCSNQDFWCDADLGEVHRSIEPQTRPIVPVLCYSTKRDMKLYNKNANGEGNLGVAIEDEPESESNEEGLESDDEDVAHQFSKKNVHKHREETDSNHWVSSTDTSRSDHDDSTIRKRKRDRGKASGKASGKARAKKAKNKKATSKGLQPGSNCYALDCDQNGSWYLTKGLLFNKPKLRKGQQRADLDLRIRFNGERHPFTYKMKDVFSSRKEANSETTKRNDNGSTANGSDSD
jgi:hypothetical protein